MYFLPFIRWPEHERLAMRYAHGTLLDIGSGAGGIHCTDNHCASPSRPCIGRGVKDAKVDDNRNICYESAAFDAGLMLGSNFALLRDTATAKHTCCAYSLKLLMQTRASLRCDRSAFRKFEYYCRNTATQPATSVARAHNAYCYKDVCDAVVSST